ncbi:MAG: hypothetical protein ABI885_28745 [Gammaproteobacteria bacterium]
MPIQNNASNYRDATRSGSDRAPDAERTIEEERDDARMAVHGRGMGANTLHRG